MKEPYGEGVASHTGPEPCVAAREGVGEALAGARAGRVLSRERFGQTGVPTPSIRPEGNIDHIASARCGRTPRGRRPRARAETPRPGPGRSRVRQPHDGAAARMANPTGARP